MKTLIGVLASHDSPEKNAALAAIFKDAFEDRKYKEILTNFRFVFTGGTYKRLIMGAPADGQEESEVNHKLSDDVIEILHNQCGIICLPSMKEGGVTVLSNLIIQRKINILWAFFSPLTSHLLYPQNLALLRIADLYHIKKLMNSGSVNEWIQYEADRDIRLNPQDTPIIMNFHGSVINADIPSVEKIKLPEFKECILYKEAVFPDLKDAPDRVVLALISHDAMKDRMLDFVLDYEHELERFRSILTTGTTGKIIQEAVPSLSSKIKRLHSGPKGGDIEIATEILLGGCHVVVFFVDPLHPHAHTEDIRVVFAACMIQDKVRMLSNEACARDWMDRMIRGR